MLIIGCCRIYSIMEIPHWNKTMQKYKGGMHKKPHSRAHKGHLSQLMEVHLVVPKKEDFWIQDSSATYVQTPSGIDRFGPHTPWIRYGCLSNLIFSSHTLSQIWTFDYLFIPKKKETWTPSQNLNTESAGCQKQQQNVDRKSTVALECSTSPSTSEHHLSLGIQKIPSMFPKLRTLPARPLLALQCTPTCAIATNTYMTHAVPEGAHRGKAPGFSDTQRINLTCKVSKEMCWKRYRSTKIVPQFIFAKQHKSPMCHPNHWEVERPSRWNSVWSSWEYGTQLPEGHEGSVEVSMPLPRVCEGCQVQDSFHQRNLVAQGIQHRIPPFKLPTLAILSTIPTQAAQPKSQVLSLSVKDDGKSSPSFTSAKIELTCSNFRMALANLRSCFFWGQ